MNPVSYCSADVQRPLGRNDRGLPEDTAVGDVCNSTADPCPDHPNARRYHDPIEYDRAEGGGWRVPDAERERWEKPPRIDTKSAGVARPIQQLVVELEAWLFLSDTLETTVRAAYTLNPQRTTRLVEKTVAGAREQTLDRPDAYLAKHAAQIASPTE